MRLDERHNIGGECANGEQTRGRRLRIRHGHVLRWLFDGSARLWKGFDRLPRVAAEAVLKYHRQSSAPCVGHVEDRRSFCENLV